MHLTSLSPAQPGAAAPVTTTPVTTTLALPHCGPLTGVDFVNVDTNTVANVVEPDAVCGNVVDVVPHGMGRGLEIGIEPIDLLGDELGVEPVAEEHDSQADGSQNDCTHFHPLLVFEEGEYHTASQDVSSQLPVTGNQ